ncbi:MAG: hypothetical protein NTW80_12440 [Deltaproteobacteria bacterium]|nr:hypothetical protein [Deltaproteobacteria bacterium]
MRTTRMLLSLAMVMLLLAFAAPGQAQPQNISGTVSIDLTSVAAGIGASWGKGVLRYQGRTYRFSVSGLSVGDVGFSSISAVGNVYNLYRPLDIAGNYAAVGAGIAVAGGVGGVTMKNQKGVLIQLYSVQQGVQLTIGPQGFNIEMK